MKILVTGAGGFVGKHYQNACKSPLECIPVSLRTTSPDEINMEGIDAIVHLAVVAHDPGKSNDDIQYTVNVELTRSLAERAKAYRVPHFVFMSSVKVYGENSDAILNEDSLCFPVDAYGKSKLQAENMLLNMQSDNFTISIIRPPIVYGPEVKANMLKMLKLAATKMPVPLGGIHNQRSIVYIGNLIALINRVIDKRTPGIFIAGDPTPVSSSYILEILKHHLKTPGKLIRIPGFFRLIIKAVKPTVYHRLFGSFVVDTSSTNTRLAFQPPYSTIEGMKEMVNWFVGTQKK